MLEEPINSIPENSEAEEERCCDLPHPFSERGLRGSRG